MSLERVLPRLDELARRRSCGLCRRRFSGPWLLITGRAWPENVLISGEAAFHWHDSHGYPVELLAETVSGWVFAGVRS